MAVSRFGALFSALVVGGLVWRAWRTPVRGWGGLAAVLLLGLLSLNVLLYVVYNITYVQHQGRYLFASMVPLGVGAAVGLEPYVKWVARRWPWTADLFPLVLAGSLALLCAYALRTHIIPNLEGDAQKGWLRNHEGEDRGRGGKGGREGREGEAGVWGGERRTMGAVAHERGDALG